MVLGWFRRNQNDSQQSPLPAIVTPKFHEQLATWNETLTQYVKESSAVISADVYSRLRHINDVVQDIVKFLENHPVRAEDEYILKATVTEYIPSAINLFNQLPAHERSEGGEADKLLLSQCETMERSLRDLNSELHERAKTSLATQAMFIEDRFKNAP